MSTYIANNGHTIIWAGADGDPASSTCGMIVVRARREMTASELATDREFLSRIKVAPVNAAAGAESYGEAHSARNAWISSLPRVAS